MIHVHRERVVTMPNGVIRTNGKVGYASSRMQVELGLSMAESNMCIVKVMKKRGDESINTLQNK